MDFLMNLKIWHLLVIVFLIITPIIWKKAGPQKFTIIILMLLATLSIINLVVNVLQPATRGPMQLAFIGVFSISAICYIFSISHILRKNINLGTGLMIAGGVLTLPIGIIAIILGLVARKKLK